MNRSYLGLGSNLKSPERQIRQALKALRGLPKTSVHKIAPFYFNPAWGKKTLPNYCNTVLEIHTTLPPLVLLTKCQQLEKKQGRVRKGRYAARTLDIDILWYAERKYNSPKLKLPHPHIFKRDFVLIPLNHIKSKPFPKFL